MPLPSSTLPTPFLDECATRSVQDGCLSQIVRRKKPDHTFKDPADRSPLTAYRPTGILDVLKDIAYFQPTAWRRCWLIALDGWSADNSWTIGVRRDCARPKCRDRPRIAELLVMTAHPVSTPRPSANKLASLRGIVAAIALAAALGSAFLWWRTSHIDRNGRIPQPNIAVNVPCLLLQATALQNGLHGVCMTGYPKWKLAAQFERQTHIHEPGYARAHNISWAGFRFVVLLGGLTTQTRFSRHSVQSCSHTGFLFRSPRACFYSLLTDSEISERCVAGDQ